MYMEDTRESPSPKNLLPKLRFAVALVHVVSPVVGGVDRCCGSESSKINSKAQANDITCPASRPNTTGATTKLVNKRPSDR